MYVCDERMSDMNCSYQLDDYQDTQVIEVIEIPDRFGRMFWLRRVICEGLQFANNRECSFVTLT